METGIEPELTQRCYRAGYEPEAPAAACHRRFLACTEREAMAQWQRVGFQTRRLGVRIPLASPFPITERANGLEV